MKNPLFFYLFVSSEYIPLERYLSPLSGKITTRFFPAFSARFATLIAAQSAAPEEIPIEIPSVFAESLAVS